MKLYNGLSSSFLSDSPTLHRKMREGVKKVKDDIPCIYGISDWHIPFSVLCDICDRYMGVCICDRYIICDRCMLIKSSFPKRDKR